MTDDDSGCGESACATWALSAERKQQLLGLKRFPCSEQVGGTLKTSGMVLGREPGPGEATQLFREYWGSMEMETEDFGPRTHM